MKSRGDHMSHNPVTKTQVCRNFLRGWCSYGAQCKYWHPSEEVISQMGDKDSDQRAAVYEQLNSEEPLDREHRDHSEDSVYEPRDQPLFVVKLPTVLGRRCPQMCRDRVVSLQTVAESSNEEFAQKRPPLGVPPFGNMKIQAVVKIPPTLHIAAACGANYIAANKKSYDHWDSGTRSWAWRDESNSWEPDPPSSPPSSSESSPASSSNHRSLSSQSSTSLPREGVVINNYYRTDTIGKCWNGEHAHCNRYWCKYRHDDVDGQRYASSNENYPHLRPVIDRRILQGNDSRHRPDHSRGRNVHLTTSSPAPLSHVRPEDQLRSAESPASSTLQTRGSLKTSPPRPFLQKRRDNKAPVPSRFIEPPSMPPPEFLTITVLDHTKVRFGPGFHVRDVTTGFETRWVIIGNIPSHVTAADVTGILEPFGAVVSVRLPENGSPLMTVKAQFSNSVEAMQASTLLNGARVFDQTISARLGVNNTTTGNAIFNDTTVRLQWDAPGRLGFAGYSSLSEAEAAIFNANKAPLRGSFVTAALYEGLPSIDAYNVRFHLPSDAEVKDVEMFGHSEGIMLQRPNYLSLENAVNRIRQMLEELGEATFEILPPPHKDGLVKAWAHFLSPPVAKFASDYLNGRRFPFIGQRKIWVNHTQTVSYALPANIYSKVATDIDLLRESCWKRGHATFVTVDRRKQALDSNQPVFVKLSGDSTRDLSRLKTELEICLRGEPLRQEGKPVWDDFFSRAAGVTFLRELEGQYLGVSIESDVPRRSMALFGPLKERASARDAILQKVTDLRGQQIRTIHLAGKVIGIFMSADLMKLQDELGHENVILRLLERTLTIRGNDAAYEAALQAVHNAQSRSSGGRCHKSMECPVCFNEVSSPVTLQCGHSWCQSCLSSYLTAASDNKLFPLTCLGNEAKCSQLVSLTVAQEVLSAREFEDLTCASFLAYIRSRPNEFHHCPTPDCAQVYRTAPQDTVLQCPSCLTRICPSCHVEYHDGQDCADRQNSGERLFREWTKLHNVKNCPGCRAPIEKSEGCNHLTCIRCQTHICWVCMKTFSKGEKIYEHMREEHGGIGL